MEIRDVLIETLRRNESIEEAAELYCGINGYDIKRFWSLWREVKATLDIVGYQHLNLLFRGIEMTLEDESKKFLEVTDRVD